MVSVPLPPTWFLVLVGLLLVQRVAELFYARHTARKLLAAGAKAIRPDGMRGIVAVHVLFFVGILVESSFAPWASPAALPIGIALLAAGQFMRYWSMVTLRWRWNTRVYIVPGMEPVRSGPYRWLDHPIYVGVTLELAGFALLDSLYVTTLTVNVLNVLALRRRVAIEEAALAGKRVTLKSSTRSPSP